MADTLTIDLAEYGDAHASYKLFGAPRGYVGSGRDGVLVDLVKKNPRARTLNFLNVARAHESIRDALASLAQQRGFRAPNGVELDLTRYDFNFDTPLSARPQRPGQRQDDRFFSPRLML